LAVRAQGDASRNRTGREETQAMMIPIRCFTCGKLIADRWEEFARRVKAGERPKKVLDDLGMTRYCCRRMFISQVDVVDDLLRYAQVTAKRRAQFE
jgi:DNA-directed RNA polymerase subunit N